MRYAVATLLLVAMLPAQSYADANVDPRVRYSIETITPSITGLTVSIYPPITVHFPPQVVADNLSNADVIVLDGSSKPMLKVGPTGSYLNAASATGIGALDPSGVAGSHPTDAGKHPSVVWQRLSSSRRLTWYETRAQYGATGPANPRVPAPLKTFRIPLLAGKQRISVDGRVSWSPILGAIVPAVLSIDPAIKGVSVIAQKGLVPAIEITNASKEVIEITGSDGLPFARVGPGGVDQNVNSPLYRDTKLLPPSTTHTVQWVHEQHSHVLLWLEKRLVTKEPSFEQEQKSTTIELNHWTIPATINGKPLSINGINRWIAYPAATQNPSPASGKAFPWAAVLGGIALGAGAGIMAVARRRAAKAPT